MSGEAASRAHLDLPGRQREFAEAVLERAESLHKPVIGVLFSRATVGNPVVGGSAAMRCLPPGFREVKRATRSAMCCWDG